MNRSLLPGWLLALTVSANAADFEWPAAWSEPMPLASEKSIRDLQESPTVTAAVLAGELPAIANRIPADPPVVTPLAGPGVYGGQARLMFADYNPFINLESPVTMGPDVSGVLPNLAESWSWSDDGRQLTLKLRDGLHWSDGMPFTSADFHFNHYSIRMHPDFAPVVPKQWHGAELIVIDERTFRYEFVEPYPMFLNLLAQLGDYFYSPAHFIGRVHPDHAGEELAAARLKAMGFIGWPAYVDAMIRGRISTPPFPPTMRTHYLASRTPTVLHFKRNPYYFKVDPLGRQLPYIDDVRAEFVTNREVMAAKAATGQVDFAGYSLRTRDFPLFKLGEQTAGIRALEWNRLHGSDVVIRPNLNYADPKLTAVYLDFRFRRALSLAINRQEMNDIIYFGRGTPRQVTVIPTSEFFEQRFADQHAEYDPDTARALLDEMGLFDRDGDELREFADGSPLIITMEFVDIETPKADSLELIASYWREVGIDLRLKPVDGALQNQRARAGLMQMTVWHGDRSTDMLFPVQPYWYLPISIGWEGAHWNEWTRWYHSNGELGEAPVASVAAALEAWTEMQQTMDPERRVELGKRILGNSTERLWTIGTVGLAPHPVVISGRLRGVPERGWWGWDNRWTQPYHPATWYLEPSGRGVTSGSRAVGGAR